MFRYILLMWHFIISSPVQVIGGLVEKCVVLSDKFSPDKLGTGFLHHHIFGQLVLTASENTTWFFRRKN